MPCHIKYRKVMRPKKSISLRKGNKTKVKQVGGDKR